MYSGGAARLLNPPRRSLLLRKGVPPSAVGQLVQGQPLRQLLEPVVLRNLSLEIGTGRRATGELAHRVGDIESARIQRVDNDAGTRRPFDHQRHVRTQIARQVEARRDQNDRTVPRHGRQAARHGLQHQERAAGLLPALSDHLPRRAAHNLGRHGRRGTIQLKADDRRADPECDRRILLRSDRRPARFDRPRSS
jgi:hypothetical protein